MDRLKLDNLDELILDPTQRHVEPREGQIGTFRAFTVPESIDEATRTMRVKATTRSLDRYGELVEPEAAAPWLATYMMNPVFMAGHVYSAPDGSPTTIGTVNDMKIVKDGIDALVQFMDDDDDELALRYWRRYRKGIQKAVSLGFIVHKWEMREVKISGVMQRVRVFTEIEIVELSAVAIPANRGSLVRAASAFKAPANVHARSGEYVTRDEIEQVIAKQLDTGPGGLMHTLMMDAMEHVLAGVGLSVDYYSVPDPLEGPDSDTDPDDGDATGEDIKQALREAADRLG